MSNAIAPSESKSSSALVAELKFARIVANVLERLGKPPKYHRTIVHNVFGARYRVNVWCELTPGNYFVKHSYFVKVDESGEILNSDPAIHKTYC